VKTSLEAPAGFAFRRTVLSHGWCLLPPFSLGPKASWLETVVGMPGGGARRIRLAPDRDAVRLATSGRVSRREREALVVSARRILNLDLDLGPLHGAARGDPGLAWIADAGAGRMLRSPTIFEDLVKLVLTTNCSWALTTRMTTTLVERYGEEARGGGRAFPRPEAIASAGARALRDRVRTGYRAPYLASLASSVAGGEVDPEAWERDPRAPAELRKELLSLPGVGPYVAENLLKLLGRPHGLALDSWMRAKYAALKNGGKPAKDAAIARRYARFGDFAGVALWLELTSDWFDGDEPSLSWETLS